MPDSLGWRGYDEWKVPADLPPCGSAVDEAATSEETAAIIDGKDIAQTIRKEIRQEVEAMAAATGGKVPGLAVVLVGSRKDSQTYVRSKKRACEEVGIASFGVDLPEDAAEEDILRVVQELNSDERVHGVLVQLPLPKDVDGFHPLNMGRLAMAGRDPLFVPCTPKGCIELLLRTGVDIRGKRAVVIGRSNVVGMPAALLLQRFNATVTVVHSGTPNPAEVTREADIVIAAAGVANLVRGTWLKPGAVVIDVGINAVEPFSHCEQLSLMPIGINVIEDASQKRGYRLVGDVCFEEARQVASAITPVPGGVGPMTIAMLLANTLTSAKRAYGLLDA
eukprot:jgi/Mesen1/8743/ME000052S08171